MTLAADVLHCSLAEAQERISPEEFLKWKARDRISPLDREWRADLRSAKVCAAILSSRGATVKISDFMPDFDPKPKKGMTVEEMKAIFRS